MTVENFTIKQGASFEKTILWEQNTFVYKSISGIVAQAPARLTVTGHGLPNNWRFAISNVKGMKEINAANEPPKNEEYHRATVVDANTIEINALNASGYTAYTSGGLIRYRPPVDLTGFTARMQLRKKRKDTAFLFELTTENSRLVITPASYTINIVLTDEETETFTFTRAVYDLEMIDASGNVFRPVKGTITIDPNVTR